MLSVTSYPPEFIDGCRDRVRDQVSAYRDLEDAARAAAGAGGDAGLDAAFAAFAPQFFNTLVLVLDASFVHRARGKEGKDGNPMNEVRVLCTSLLEHGGVLTADKQIKLKAATSVLHLEAGDPIALTETDFGRLADAYFDAIAGTYG